MGKIFHVGHGNHEDARSWSVPHWSPKAAAKGGYALPDNRGPPRSARRLPLASRPGPKTPNLPRGSATECADVPDTTYGDGLIADEAIRRLRAAKDQPGKPFFLARWLSETAPAVCRTKEVLGSVRPRRFPAASP